MMEPLSKSPATSLVRSPNIAKQPNLDPSHAGIRANYGVALLRLGKWAEGLNELYQALQLDPHNEQLRTTLKDALSQAPETALPSWKDEVR